MAILREGRLIADGLTKDVLGDGEARELFRGSDEDRM